MNRVFIIVDNLTMPPEALAAILALVISDHSDSFMITNSTDQVKAMINEEPQVNPQMN